jgi:hypothetical protein
VKLPLLLVIALNTLLWLSCSDKSANPQATKAEVSGLVTAYYCYGDATTLNYALTTGKQGYVALARADGLQYLAVTDRMSEISLTVDTGLYDVVVTTFHMAPDTIFKLHIVHDTSGIEFWSRLDYTPPDSLVMRIEYFPGDSVFTDSEEQHAIGYMVQNLPDSLSFAPAWRSVSYEEPGHSIVSYVGIALLGNQPSWRADRKSVV